MEFVASAEVHGPAFAALDAIRRRVDPVLKDALRASDLVRLQCTLRYVPIVMPAEMHGRYPARSKLRKKQRIYDSAPILDYDVFVDGRFEDQLREYLRGIAMVDPYLTDLGASADQIREFNAILARVVERVLAEQPGETRH